MYYNAFFMPLGIIALPVVTDTVYSTRYLYWRLYFIRAVTIVHVSVTVVYLKAKEIVFKL